MNRGKELKRMTGLKHDLLTNASAAVCEHAADWVLDRLKAVSTDVGTNANTVTADTTEIAAADVSK
jgi:hypothetical protein